MKTLTYALVLSLSFIFFSTMSLNAQEKKKEIKIKIAADANSTKTVMDTVIVFNDSQEDELESSQTRIIYLDENSGENTKTMIIEGNKALSILKGSDIDVIIDKYSDKENADSVIIVKKVIVLDDETEDSTIDAESNITIESDSVFMTVKIDHLIEDIDKLEDIDIQSFIVAEDDEIKDYQVIFKGDKSLKTSYGRDVKVYVINKDKAPDKELKKKIKQILKGDNDTEFIIIETKKNDEE